MLKHFSLISGLLISLLACQNKSPLKTLPQATINKKAPLNIFFEEKIALKYRWEIASAALYWNDKLGCTVFKSLGPKESNIDVFIKKSTRFNNIVANTEFISWKRKTSKNSYEMKNSAVIHIRNVTNQNLEAVFRHEFGHVLGLAHAKIYDRGHVMHPTMGPLRDELSSKEIKYLQKKFCK